MIKEIRIPVKRCTNGIYLRWYYNGWHYYCFTNEYEITMQTESAGIQVMQVFSRISKTEIDTKISSKYSYHVTVTGISDENIEGFHGLLLAEKVEQYETQWYEVEITRGLFKTLEAGKPAHELTFEIWRNDLPNQSSTYQKSQILTIGSTVCDIDDGEVIAQTKQVNDIAEMQDRQSDFTASFKIRKTRAMRALFELSGEVGSNTNFPYTTQTARLVQDGIEMISYGVVVLEKADEQYYYISILSGNLNFFKAIEGKKISDLSLPDAVHTWDAQTQANSHALTHDYLYPALEPSDDAGIIPLTDDGTRAEVYGGWIWPFVKIKAIWDEIFVNAGFTCSGKILTDDKFLKTYMPITSLKPTNTAEFLYSLHWSGVVTIADHDILPGGDVINGTALFGTGHYIAPFDGSYTFQVTTVFPTSYPAIYLFKNGVEDSTFVMTYEDPTHSTHEITVTLVAGDDITFHTSGNTLYEYTIAVTKIDATKIGYTSPVNCATNLPAMTQTEFIKMVCNLFGLIPDAKARGRNVNFFNYSVLYDNITLSRDWSYYLSEKQDEVVFKFGDYAQNNYMRYKDSDDVIENTGIGTLQVNDLTLPIKKDVVSLPVSSTDEVLVLTDQRLSRIDFNKYDTKTDSYSQNENIDPRLVYISTSTGKTFGFRDALTGGTSYDVSDPKKATSAEIAFSSMGIYYAGLSRMLTKTNLRKAKFNLPAYEVAGFRHDIPIYLRQYKAYFYVNKITNYVVGKLCTIELIKL